MDNKEYITILTKVVGVLKASIVTLSILMILVLGFGYEQLNTKKQSFAATESTKKQPEVLDGIHTQTGLIDAPGLALVVQNCTPCHSAKLITQNRMTESGWTSTIRWMQETQNLWELGTNEAQIIAYLATNYAPEKKGRRAQLTNIVWYELE